MEDLDGKAKRTRRFSLPATPEKKLELLGYSGWDYKMIASYLGVSPAKGSEIKRKLYQDPKNRLAYNSAVVSRDAVLRVEKNSTFQGEVAEVRGILVVKREISPEAR